ncbi:hypothetical protein EJB05_54376, partial [Eragrostis curvula]
HAVRVVRNMTVSEGLVMGLVLVCVRYVWGHAYSDEEEVVTYVARMMLLIAASYFFDGIQCPLAGAIVAFGKINTLWDMYYVSAARGCGWQKIGAWVNLGAFYAGRRPGGIPHSLCSPHRRNGTLSSLIPTNF